MSFFPMYIEMKDLPVLVVGGGPVALRKVETLCSFGARISVVSPHFCDGFRREIGSGTRLKLLHRRFKPEDLDGIKLAVVAAGNASVNCQIVGECRKRNIPVNVVDVPQLCDFFFPAVVRRGELTVGICSGGGAPAFSRLLREYLDNRLPGDLEEDLNRIAARRKSVLDGGARPAEDQEYLVMIDRLMDRIKNSG